MMRKQVIKIVFVDACTELIELETPASVSDADIRTILTKTNAHLFDAGIYDMYGLSAETLLNEIVKTHPTWKYRCIQPDITWSDT